VASYDEDSEDDDSSLPLPLLPLSPEEEAEEEEAGEEDAELACSKSWPRSIGETKARGMVLCGCSRVCMGQGSEVRTK
jgi:hypothetical protein